MVPRLVNLGSPYVAFHVHLARDSSLCSDRELQMNGNSWNSCPCWLGAAMILQATLHPQLSGQRLKLLPVACPVSTGCEDLQLAERT